MKIRNGFVSNSSSSSFIINISNIFSTVKDVAIYIMDNIPYDTYTEERKTLDILSNPDTPVFFNTGGDETYIRKVDNKIVIETTQNITFELLHENCLTRKDLTEEFCKKFEYLDIDEEYPLEKGEIPELITLEDPREFYFHGIFDDFNILQYNILGKHDYIRSCPHCKNIFSLGWKLKGGKRICECQIEKHLLILSRKDKINKITEQSSVSK